MAQPKNILVTGGAGYIGGSVLAKIITQTTGPFKDVSISTIVRSPEQAKKLSSLGVKVIQADLTDEKAILEAVLDNNIDLVVHTATSFILPIALNIVRALGHSGRISGKKTYFINSSITTAFSEAGGWPDGEVKDTDNLYETEKEIGDSHPVRITNIGVMAETKAQGVEFFNLAVPVVYGKGTGQWKKISTNIPAFVRNSIENKVVYKFEKNGSPPSVHVADLADLYILLVQKILQAESIPSGEKGYYFGFSHRLPWWEVMERIAQGLHTRGLVNESTARIWPSWEVAADQLKWPVQHIRAMGASTGQHVAVNPYLLGWEPKWNQKKFLESIDDEIQDALDNDALESTLFDTIL